MSLIPTYAAGVPYYDGAYAPDYGKIYSQSVLNYYDLEGEALYEYNYNVNTFNSYVNLLKKEGFIKDNEKFYLNGYGYDVYENYDNNTVVFTLIDGTVLTIAYLKDDVRSNAVIVPVESGCYKGTKIPDYDTITSAKATSFDNVDDVVSVKYGYSKNSIKKYRAALLVRGFKLAGVNYGNDASYETYANFDTLDSVIIIYESNSLKIVYPVGDAKKKVIKSESNDPKSHTELKKDEQGYVTLYTEDGRSKKFRYEDAQSQLEVGWYAQPVKRLYAAYPKEKSAVFKKSDVAAQLTVGWYEYPVQMLYAPGKCKVFKKSEVPAQLTVGWYKEPLVKMYASDGREKYTEYSKIYENRLVGWSTDQFKWNKVSELASYGSEYLKNNIGRDKDIYADSNKFTINKIYAGVTEIGTIQDLNYGAAITEEVFGVVIDYNVISDGKSTSKQSIFYIRDGRITQMHFPSFTFYNIVLDKSDFYGRYKEYNKSIIKV